MAAIEPRLFTWEEVEARSDLDRFFLVRDHLPDEQIIHSVVPSLPNRRVTLGV